MSKILCIGDLHLKDNLGYADYITDRRIPEKKEILDFIVEQSKDCEKIVFMGDQFNSKHNSPQTIKDFVEFIEKFSGKEVFVLTGNHTKYGDGRAVEDFLKEIKNPLWHIITDKVEKFGNLTFCPWFTRAELGTNSDEESTKKIIKMLEPNDVLFHHHTTSETITSSGIDVSIFAEPILPVDELTKRFKQVVGGHIHKPQVNKTIITGSIFTNEVGEIEKYIFKIDDKDPTKMEQIKIPGRGIFKLENPTTEDLEKITDKNILKVIITKKQDLDELRKQLKRFDAYILIEQIPKKRKKMVYGKGESILEFDINDLLKLYAKEKNINIKSLQHAMDIIR